MSEQDRIKIEEIDLEPHVKHLLDMFEGSAGYMEVRRDGALLAIIAAPLRTEAFGPLYDAAVGRKPRIHWSHSLISGLLFGAVLVIIRLMTHGG